MLLLPDVQMLYDVTYGESSFCEFFIDYERYRGCPLNSETLSAFMSFVDAENGTSYFFANFSLAWQKVTEYGYSADYLVDVGTATTMSYPLTVAGSTTVPPTPSPSKSNSNDNDDDDDADDNDNTPTISPTHALPPDRINDDDYYDDMPTMPPTKRPRYNPTAKPTSAPILSDDDNPPTKRPRYNPTAAPTSAPTSSNDDDDGDDGDDGMTRSLEALSKPSMIQAKPKGGDDNKGDDNKGVEIHGTLSAGAHEAAGAPNLFSPHGTDTAGPSSTSTLPCPYLLRGHGRPPSTTSSLSSSTSAPKLNPDGIVGDIGGSTLEAVNNAVVANREGTAGHDMDELVRRDEAQGRRRGHNLVGRFLNFIFRRLGLR